MKASGVQRSVLATYRKSAGITPTTVYDSPLSVSARPTTCGSAAEPPLPEGVAENDDAVRAGAVFLVEEGAAEPRGDPEQREEVGRDLEALEPLRLALAGEVRGPADVAERRDVGEDAVVALQVQVGQRRHRPELVAARRVVDRDELLGPVVRQRLQQDRRSPR